MSDQEENTPNSDEGLPSAEPSHLSPSWGPSENQESTTTPFEDENVLNVNNDSISETEESETEESETEESETETESAPVEAAPSETAHEAATRYAAAGFSMVAVNPQTKRPFGGWKKAQSVAVTASEVSRWPYNERTSFAVVCGAVSGGYNEDGQALRLTILDFDVPELYEPWAAKVGELANRLSLQQTGGGGYQAAFRSPLETRNEKLAWVPDEKEDSARSIAIETRGEGGYAVMPPSRHPSGRLYRWLRGDLTATPILSEAEAQQLIDAARSLDQAPYTKQVAAQQVKREANAKEKKYKTNKQGRDIVGDFNAAHTVEELLERHGYTRTGERFARPGGSSPSVHITEDGRSFHHSSNDPLSDGYNHTAFDIYCQLEHGGEFLTALQAAAAELGIEWRASGSASQRRDDKRQEFEALAAERGVPLISVTNRQLREKLIDLEGALVQANMRQPRVFAGSQGLVKVSVSKGREPALVALDSFAMQVLASEAAIWIGESSRGQSIQVDPPRDLTQNLLVASDYHHDFPPIERVSSTPFVAANGELCGETGYYESERTFLALSDGFELGDTTPTPENIKAAKRLILRMLLGEVEFEDSASRAHAVALMILPFVRSLIQGPTPLHMIMAPEVSSGKSYLANICLLPSTTPTPTSEKGNLEEWRKSLIAKLVTGAPAVWLDNIKKNLNSPTLDMAITSPSGYIEDRLTGTGVNVCAPSWCVWVATANNLTLTDDAASRAVVISIVPTQEKPSQRRFRHRPDHFIRQHRGQVCGAILTLVRAWQEADCPDYSGKFSTRFPEWTRIIGGILETVGIEGFLENLEKQRDLLADDMAEGWSELLMYWERDFGEAPVSALDVLPLAQKVALLSAALSGAEGDAKYRRFAQLLAKQRNRIYSGIQIVDGPKVQRKVTYQLRVLPLTPPIENADDFDAD